MKKYKVYLFIFPNGKFYCGYTSQTLQRRWDNGNGYKKCPLVYKAIQKYGWDNITKKLIFDSDIQEEALNKERQVIKELNLTNPNYGYNLDEGGRPHGGSNFLTEEGRKKISEAGKKKWQNPEFRQYMSEISRKRMLGTHLSKETINKIQETRKINGVKMPSNAKIVQQLDPLTEIVIKEFSSGGAAAREVMGETKGGANILAVCRGKRKSAYGYKWRFKHE